MPSYVILGRSAWDEAWMPWQSLAHVLARSRHVTYVRDTDRSSVSPLGGTVRTLPNGVIEVVPFDYPLQRLSFVRKFAIRAHSRRIRGTYPGDHRPLVLVLTPRADLQLALALAPDLLIYYAIDDFSEMPTGEKDTRFLEWEQAAVSKCNLVVCSSEAIATRIRDSGAPPVMTITNGYDDEYLDGRPQSPPRDISNLPHPVLGFIGTVRASRLNVPLINELALHRPTCSFLFVGSVFDDDKDSLKGLRAHANVHFIGFRSREEVAPYIASIDVAIIPYTDARVNRACYPLKALDALAMGKPVVMSPSRRDLQHLGPGLHCADDAPGFLRALDSALLQNGTAGAPEARKEAVRALSWRNKAEEFEGAVRAHLRMPSGDSPRE